MPNRTHPKKTKREGKKKRRGKNEKGKEQERREGKEEKIWAPSRDGWAAIGPPPIALNPPSEFYETAPRHRSCLGKNARRCAQPVQKLKNS